MELATAYISEMEKIKAEKIKYGIPCEDWSLFHKAETSVMSVLTQKTENYLYEVYQHVINSDKDCKVYMGSRADFYEIKRIVESQPRQNLGAIVESSSIVVFFVVDGKDKIIQYCPPNTVSYFKGLRHENKDAYFINVDKHSFEIFLDNNIHLRDANKIITVDLIDAIKTTHKFKWFSQSETKLIVGLDKENEIGLVSDIARYLNGQTVNKLI